MLDDFQPPSFNMDEVSDPNNLETHFINATGLISYDFFKQSSDYPFTDWNFDSNTDSEFTFLSKIAQSQGFDIYIADYGHLGDYACRIIIPGMSEIYPVEDLLWSNNNEGAYFREAILSLKDLEQEDMYSILEDLEEGEYSDMLKVAEFIGVIPDADTAWQTLQIGELKAMLYLAVEDHEKAQEWVNWCIHMAVFDDKRTNMYRCLHALLEIKLEEKDLDEYKESLEMMYSSECVALSINIIERKETFYGLHSPGLSLEGFEKHKTLLEAYAKVHKSKREYYPTV
jgi:ribosomal protein S12 methylthiotransferase accessory factor